MALVADTVLFLVSLAQLHIMQGTLLTAGAPAHGAVVMLRSKYKASHSSTAKRAFIRLRLRNFG